MYPTPPSPLKENDKTNDYFNKFQSITVSDNEEEKKNEPKKIKKKVNGPQIGASYVIWNMDKKNELDTRLDPNFLIIDQFS